MLKTVSIFFVFFLFLQSHLHAKPPLHDPEVVFKPGSRYQVALTNIQYLPAGFNAGKRQSGNLFLPTQRTPRRPVIAPPCGFPLVIFEDGGYWLFLLSQVNDIRNFHMSIPARLVEAGFAVMIGGYTLTQINPPCDVINDPTNANHCGVTSAEGLAHGLGAEMDAVHMVQHMRHHASRYRINPNKIYVAGLSAGAINALYAAYSVDHAQPIKQGNPLTQLNQSSKPRGVVAIGAPCLLQAFIQNDFPANHFDASPGPILGFNPISIVPLQTQALSSSCRFAFDSFATRQSNTLIPGLFVYEGVPMADPITGDYQFGDTSIYERFGRTETTGLHNAWSGLSMKYLLEQIDGEMGTDFHQMNSKVLLLDSFNATFYGQALEARAFDPHSYGFVSELFPDSDQQIVQWLLEH